MSEPNPSMATPQPFDGFPPAPTADAQSIAQDHEHLQLVQHMAAVLDAMPDAVLILNSQRQTIFANATLARILGLPDSSSLLARRPGDILACIHAKETPGGCGTTEFCKECGAAKAIYAAQRGRAAIEECRIMRVPPLEALDLRVFTTPLNQNGRRLTIFAIADIRHEKRRDVMERVFFHDVLNTVGGLENCVYNLREVPTEKVDTVLPDLASLTHRLRDEIRAQRELTTAESGSLELNLARFSAGAVIDDLVATSRYYEAAADRTIRTDILSPDTMLTTDPVLLLRVLGNMLKNALEAATPGQTVTVRAAPDESHIAFSVHNPGSMPASTQRQIFQRSFSTKGPGRGIGTYSIKLLTERYLEGTASFHSTPETGTTFTVRIPLRPATRIAPT